MTAEEFMESKEGLYTGPRQEEEVVILMVEFAKYHVQEALKKVELVDQSTGNLIGEVIYSDAGDKLYINKDTAYPLENIK